MPLSLPHGHPRGLRRQLLNQALALIDRCSGRFAVNSEVVRAERRSAHRRRSAWKTGISVASIEPKLETIRPRPGIRPSASSPTGGTEEKRGRNWVVGWCEEAKVLQARLFGRYAIWLSFNSLNSLWSTCVTNFLPSPLMCL